MRLLYLFFFMLLTVGSLVVFACNSNLIQNQSQNARDLTSSTPTPNLNTLEKTERDELLNKARSLQAMGKADEAIDLYEKLLLYNHPSKIEIHRSMAEIYLGLGNYDKAAMHYRSIVDIEPSDARGHWALANVLIVNLKECKAGLAEAETAQKTYGHDGLEYVRDRIIGKAHDCLGNKQKAVEFYKRFLNGASFAPDSADFKETSKRVSELLKQR